MSWHTSRVGAYQSASFGLLDGRVLPRRQGTLDVSGEGQVGSCEVASK